MKYLAKPLVIKPDLELGKSYKLTSDDGDNRKPNKIKNTRLVYLDKRLAVFDNGLYKDCQMIKNYKQDWEVTRI